MVEPKALRDHADLISRSDDPDTATALRWAASEIEQLRAELSRIKGVNGMAERLGDAPIDPAYREKMNKLASALDEIFNGDARGDDRKVGFVLLVFEFGEKQGRANYISNGADRSDIVTLFKEQIKRFEGQPDIIGHA
jgi:hypothetical protein